MHTKANGHDSYLEGVVEQEAVMESLQIETCSILNISTPRHTLRGNYFKRIFEMEIDGRKL